MSDQVISLPLANIIDSATFVPAAERAAFLATLLVGASGYEASMGEPVFSDDDDEDTPSSVSLTASQARKLKEKLDPATWEVIRATVSNVTDDVGTVDWSKVKELTGVANWTVFAKGRLGGLNRALRNIEGVPPKAILLWEGEGWLEDGEGDYSAGTLAIDGPVVRTLRSVMGIED